MKYDTIYKHDTNHKNNSLRLDAVITLKHIFRNLKLPDVTAALRKNTYRMNFEKQSIRSLFSNK